MKPLANPASSHPSSPRSFFRLALLAACLLALLAAPSLHAATRTWDNGAGTNVWGTAANWSGDTLPTTSDTVIINNGNTVYANLTLPSSLQITVSGNSILSSNVNATTTGVIRLSSANITVESGSSLSGGNFWDLDRATMTFHDGSIANMGYWEFKGNNTTKFILGASGFTTLTPSTLRASGVTTANQTYAVDFASYTGGPATITLMDFTTNSFTTLNATSFQSSTFNYLNLPGNLAASMSWNGTTNAIKLDLTKAWRTWAGGTGNWTTGFSSNPTNQANLAFTGAGGTATNNISSATLTTLTDIEFRSGAGAYTLAANAGSAGASGGTALTINGSIINNSTNTQTVNMDLAFAATRTIDTNTGNITIGGVVSGAGGLTKNGASTLILSSTNTYNGSTTINAGTLQIDGNIANSGLVINSGGTISPGTTAAADSFGTSSISINGGGYNWTLNNAYGSAGTDWDQITSTGALTSSGVLTVNIYGDATGWNDSTNYSWDILSAASLSGSFVSSNFGYTIDANFNGGNAPTGTFTFSNPSGGIIRMTYTAPTGPVWTGSSGNWSTGFSANVTNGDAIAFSGTSGGTATNNISSATLTTLDEIEFRSGAGAYTLAANAGSAGASGSSALTVTGSIINNSANTQTINMDVAPGSIAINSGALEIGAAGRLNSGSYSNTISNSVSLIYSGTNAQTLSGDISGTGALTKNAASTLTLTGNNTYLGATTINAGALVIDGTGRLGGGSYAGNIVMTGAFTYNSTADQTLSGQISGAGTLFKYASSNLTLSGSNSRTGNLQLGLNAGNLTGGTVKLGHNNAVGGTGGIFWENDGILELVANGLTISNANYIYARNSATDGKRRYRLDLNGSNTGTFSGNFDIRMSGLIFDVGTDDTLTASGSFSNGGGGGGFEKTGAGTLVLTGATNTLNGNIVISAGTLQIGNGGTTGTLNSLAVTNNGALVFNRSNAITVANAISGSGNVIKNASNTLTLTSASSNYTGATTITAGTISISAVGALGSTSGVNLGNATELTYTGSAATLTRAISVTSGTATVSNTGSGVLTLSGGLSKNGTTLVLDGGSNGINVTGAITGSAANSDLVVDGNVTLSTANSYNGPTTINGNLTAAVTNAMGSTTNVVINSGGSLLVTADNAINNSATINMTGGILKFSGNVTETVGLLTLSANSIIDLGTDSVAASFADLAMGFYNLSIYNWTGTTLWNGGNGDNIDKIYFNRTLTSSELSRISFYSESTQSSFLGTGFQLGFGSGFANEVIPVPEPETWATAALLLLGGTVWMWRKRSVFTTQLDLEGDAPSAPQEGRASAPIEKMAGLFRRNDPHQRQSRPRA